MKTRPAIKYMQQNKTKHLSYFIAALVSCAINFIAAFVLF